MSGSVYLVQQPLEIDGAAGTGRRNHEFHSLKSYYGNDASTIHERKNATVCDRRTIQAVSYAITAVFEFRAPLGH